MRTMCLVHFVGIVKLTSEYAISSGKTWITIAAGPYTPRVGARFSSKEMPQSQKADLVVKQLQEKYNTLEDYAYAVATCNETGIAETIQETCWINYKRSHAWACL